MTTRGPSPDPIPPGAWQGSLWSTTFLDTGMTPLGKSATGKAGFDPWSAGMEADVLPLGHRRGRYHRLLTGG